jgi:hypothetical protein
VTGRTRRHLLVWAVLVAVLTAGCGVRPSGVITGGPAPTRPARGTVLYFLADSSVAPVLRPTPEPLPAAEALALLRDGPTDDERAVDLTSEVPTGLAPVAVTADPSGGVEVAVAVDVTTLSAAAVDQIVCTVGDALPGTGSITLTGGGATRGPGTCPLTGTSVRDDAAPGPPPRR